MGKPPVGDDYGPLLLQMIEESYRLPNWNGTSLRAALRRVTAPMAGWRAPHARRSIADLVVHCAYWKYSAWRRLTGAKRGSFPFRGSNWFRTPDRIEPDQWKEYRELLEQQHQGLCEALAAFKRSAKTLRPARDDQWTLVQRVFWLAIHDGYHTGQINLIKAMYRRHTRSPATG